MELVVCVILACVAVVAAAPSLSQGELPQESVADQQQFFREKRSSYGAPIYAPPCSSSYLAPVHHAAYPQHYGYGIQAIPSLPHYRDTDEQEIMTFSDADQNPEDFMEPMMPEHMLPSARYAYGAPAVPVNPHYGAAVAGASGFSPVIGNLGAAAGPAIGVFPNANVGGCSVPLLLSCSPTIRPGHIVKSQPYYTPAHAYRGVNDAHPAHENQDTHEQLTHEATPHVPLHQ